MSLSNDLKQQSSSVQSDRVDAAGLDLDPGESVIPKTKTGKGPDKEQEEAIVELGYTDHMVEVTSLALMQQCQQAVESSAACCLALLMQGGSHGHHYFSTLRPQSKGQNDAALKTAAKQRESDEPDKAAEDKGPPATHFVQPAPGSASKPGTQSAVCFDTQGVCNKLLRLGCQLPEVWQVSMKDPKLMAWLHEPQLMQRDEKQIEGYTLQVLSARWSSASAVLLESDCNCYWPPVFFVTKPAGQCCRRREKAKRVTYGINYGLSPWGLAKGPGGLGIHVGQAQNLITSFLNHFSGLKQFLEKTKHEGRGRGYITTLNGRRRPIKALGSTEQRPVRLVAQIHDELLLEVNPQLCDVYAIAGALQIMEGVACLKVPLTVNVSYGQRWGAMQRM
ncbi:hypothetical protein WJX82_011272 [Trebouxia sp. C0006]